MAQVPTGGVGIAPHERAFSPQPFTLRSSLMSRANLLNSSIWSLFIPLLATDSSRSCRHQSTDLQASIAEADHKG